MQFKFGGLPVRVWGLNSCTCCTTRRSRGTTSSSGCRTAAGGCGYAGVNWKKIRTMTFTSCSSLSVSWARVWNRPENMVWISPSKIFCVRTQGSRICTTISLKWSYQSHRCMLYLIPLGMTSFGLKTAMQLIASSQRYWSTNPRSLRPGVKDPGPWDSHQLSINHSITWYTR